KRMLVPTDFSPASDIAFTYAIDMAAREGSTIHLLHVIDEASFATAYPDGFYVELPGLRAQLFDEANGRLTEMLARCTAAGVEATTEVAVGRVARVIAQSATNRGTDLIVIGTHGRGGFAHLVLGSVTERVIRMAPCAVLTVRDTSRIANAIAAEAGTQRHADASS
ncbi:MAG TPA: universal stress protein, partial [Vicinamibacterales bacterium]|nr:universal stress protein [Vicinamibacterales bacterium]